jgi:glycosyltransferase involved in cell wall biosynthesis
VKREAAFGRARLPRLLVIASHPIQYQAPWFRELAKVPDIDFSVLFIQQPDSQQQGVGFGIAFEWDIPLLDGYAWSKPPRVRGKGGLSGFFSTHVSTPVALLRNLAPDAVVITGWHTWPLVQLVLAARWARIPVIMRAESNALRRRPWHVRALHRLLLGRCGAFMPIGASSRDFYLSYGIGKHQLFDAPYFIDNARFLETATRLHDERQRLREQWKIPSDAVCFCYVGKLESKKRIFDLLAALRVATATARAPLHLLVVGTGELMPQAREAVNRDALPVTFAGFLNQGEIPTAYVAADCLVLPSDYGETWGLVVNEAMACGRPAIVSDRVGCAADLVIPSITGLIFPFGDVTELAERMVRMAADRQRIEAMGESARERVLQHYTVEKTVAGTQRAFAYVLEQDSR